MQISSCRPTTPISFQNSVQPKALPPQFNGASAQPDSFACSGAKPQFGCGSVPQDKPAPKTALDAFIAMFDAANTGDIKTLKQLLTRLNQLHQNNQFQLYDGQKPVNVILDQQLPLSDVPEEYRGKTLLDVAVDQDQLKAVRFLLKNGADVNPEDSNYPPLSRAVHHGNAFIASHLLHHGADANRPDKDGDRPLTVALRHVALGQDDQSILVKELIRYGAHNQPGSNGLTPLDQANNVRRMFSLEDLGLSEQDQKDD
jgi:hypothetical protein